MVEMQSPFPIRLVVILALGMALLIPLFFVVRSSKPASTAPVAAPEPVVGEPAGSLGSPGPVQLPDPVPPARPEVPRHVMTSLVEQWGISISSARLTAGGTALDVRYQVVDAEKASGMHKIKGEAYLLDDASGRNLMSKAQSQPLALQELTSGKSYFMMFPNSGGLVKRGGTVTLVVGGVRTDPIKVE